MNKSITLTIIGIVAMAFTVMVFGGPWYTIAIIVAAAGLTNLLWKSLD